MPSPYYALELPFFPPGRPLECHQQPAPATGPFAESSRWEFGAESCGAEEGNGSHRVPGMAAVNAPNPEHIADAQLLARVASGDRVATQQLINHYLPPLVRFCYRMVRDLGAAEDIAQEAFLRLWRVAPKWEPRAKLSTWLYRVARNLCIDRQRKKREIRHKPEAPECADPKSGAGAALQRQQVAGIVAKAMDALPPRQKLALELVHHQGLRNTEAAQVMDIHIDALESLLARGRRTLRQKLKRVRADL